MKSTGPVGMVLTLAVAGFFSGVALVGAYLATQPMIRENRARALEEAIYRVLPGAVERKAFIIAEGRLAPASDTDNEASPGEVAYAGYDEQGTLIGYAIPAEGPGFQDTIELLYGYSPERSHVLGMEILQSRETPGLGDKIAKDPGFVSSFRQLSTDPRIEPVKPGTGNQPNQVDTISGATISSKAVVNIINQSLTHWKPLLHTAPGQALLPSQGDATPPSRLRTLEGSRQ
ncbi:MAG TPA: FMN-binding protein [Acidobacteriota bacterium]|nr:FMN-binding protein [Acidobacteriota bacterium]